MEEAIGNVYLIPAKGILGDLKQTVIDKLSRKEIKYMEGFKLPCEKSKYEIDVVVDDDCEVCPTAVEIVSEIAALYPKNVTVKIYNITYVKPPFQPIEATPTFRINGRVRFAGIPLDPESIRKYFFNFMKEAYVLSHPKLNWLIDRVKRFAETYGYVRNPNDNAYLNLIYKLLRNIDLYGYPYCPCRPLKKKPGMSLQQIYELNKDKVCPCVYVHSDIKMRGHCLCGLFWSKEKADEYIKERLKRYGWIIKEIENIQKALEELKKRVVSGRGKMLAESIINKLQDIYVSLPD